MGENFKLKWNDHHSIFFSTAESLCQGDHLTDVTLSCGKKEFSAHKLVLSICSQYFYELFKPKQNRPANQAAIVYLKDVSPSHMELLLNFMYRGEINVEEEELMTLLNTARGLQIRGLSDNTNEDTSNNIQSETHQQYTKPKPKAVKRAKSPIVTPSRPSTSAAASAPSTSGSSNSPAKKIKPDPEADDNLESYEDIPDDSADRDPDYDDEHVYVEGNEDDYNESEQGGPMIFEGELPPPEVVMAEKQMDFKRYICSTCFKGFNSPSDLQRHERIHTGVMPYVCEYCKKGFKQKNSLKRHYLVHTGEKPYECSVCFQRFQEKAKMKYHMAMKHAEVAQQQQLAEQLQQLQAHAQNLQQLQNPLAITPDFIPSSALPKLPPPPGPHD